MKVRRLDPTGLSISRQLIVAFAVAMAIMIGSIPAPAQAITRPVVIKRAKVWIKKRVRYSQSGYYRGYRRDCSGFVSMAWRLKKSYTSSTIRRKAKRISWRKLKPGDAVRRSGHVEIFARWKNKRKRTYVALAESTWGKPALKRVKRFKHGYSALRYKGIREAKKKRPVVPPVKRPVIKPPVPVAPPVITPIVPVLPGAVPTPSVAPTGSATVSVTTRIPLS